MIVIGLLFIAYIIFLWYTIKKSPHGWEDKEGFHYGERDDGKTN